MSNKSSKAYRRIKVLIEGGHLLAGQRLTEARAAELVGMGRGPVRESLLRLEAEGLLQHQGSRRSRIVAFTEDENSQEMLSRYELREQIESGAARLAAKNMTGWQIDRLRELSEQVAEAWGEEDREVRYAASREFRRFLLEECGNALFMEVWLTQRLTPPQPRSPEVEKEIFAGIPVHEHDKPSLAEVVDAIAAHDPDRAEALMKKRVRQITEAVRSYMWRQSVG